MGAESLQAVRLGADSAKGSEPECVYKYGVPFVMGSLNLGAQVRVDIGVTAKRVFLLGMTSSRSPDAWAEARDYLRRFFVGDGLGRIRLDYADGTEQIFPLIIGESIWWGKLFYENQEPFRTDARLQTALRGALRLYPPAPVEDGNYVAVITPRSTPIRSIAIEDSPAKIGTPVITGITIETGENVAGGITVPRRSSPPDFTRFVEERALRPLGVDEKQARLRLYDLRRALYSSSENYKGHVPVETPNGYSGPKVSFKGNIFAEILANVFHYNLQDIADKITDDGMYHTSTKGAPSWGNYSGFGTYQKNRGRYYNCSFSRDMGPSLQELTEMGYIPEAVRCADYCFRSARVWEEKPNELNLNGHPVPRHWCQILSKPTSNTCLENDGHGMTAMFIYKLWQRLPERDQWLRERWVDVKAAGDWILWQFDHPEITGATDTLFTTGEAAGDAHGGPSVFADYACMDALRALAEMAESIGESQSAAQWRERAALMQKAILDRYIVDDPKYGRVWTLERAGWSNRSTVLGPLIFLADRQGFAPEDDDPEFRPANEAAYRRMLDTYRKPYGFFGTAMGYGQGFVTQSALLLDQMRDATQMLGWIAREVYDPRIGSFIVPESCQVDPTGKYWYRVGDLGNGVQEAEIVKAVRLVIGVDDTQPRRVRIFPRMPYGWTEMAVEKLPVLFEREGKPETAHVGYRLQRTGHGMKLDITSDKEMGEVAIRLGPFWEQPDEPGVLVNRNAADAVVEHSGDSWWVRLSAPVGTAPTTVSVDITH